MQTTSIYKGLTRPAMTFGVPLTPLFMVLAFISLLALYINLGIMVAIIPAIFIMKALTKQDDFIFRLIFLKFKFISPNTNKQGKLKTYNANSSYNVPKNFSFTGYPKISIFNLQQTPNFEKFLPYQSLLKDMVITKEYEFLATWEIGGVAFEIESPTDIEINKQKINMMLKFFNYENVSFYFHNCRIDIKDELSSSFNNDFLQNLNDEYFKGFKQSSLKTNRLFLTAIYSPISKMEKSNIKKNSFDSRLKQVNAFVNQFRKHCDTIESNLKDFQATRLKNYQQDGITYSRQLEFYNFLISNEFVKIKAPKAPINFSLNGNLNFIKFGKNVGELEFSTGQRKYFKTIEIKDYPSESFCGIFDILMYEDVTYTITQSFTPVHKIEAQEGIKKQIKQLISAEDDAVSQVEELNIALDELISGDLVFGKYHYTITVYADHLKEVNDKTNTITTALSDMGFLSSIATVALPASYFSQFPSNFSIRPRVHTISSLNFSDFLAFHNFPKGKSEKNPWGQAVTMLKTPNKNPYYFNFHESPYGKDNFNEMLLANTLIIGKSGGGKTMLMGFLLNQLAKYNDISTFPKDLPKAKKKATFFYLDKDRGALGNILANGGKYLNIDGGLPTGFNPFMIEASNENIRKIKILLKMLVTRNGEILSTLEEESLNNAIESVMLNFDKEDRKHGISLVLEHLTEDMGETNSLRSRLNLWEKNNKFGWVFDNEIDELNFEDKNISIYGIDGTDLLKDDEISDVVAFYILWRIMDLTDGRRFALMIDEAWDWIQNPVVAKEVHNKEKTIRKQNGFIVLGTQSVEDFANSPIATAILEQSATILLLSNPKAKHKDYVEKLNLSEEEFEFVKSTIPSTYKFIIKKAEEKAIVSIDLSNISKEYLKIMSTDSQYIDSLLNIQKQNLGYKKQLQKIKELYKEQ